VKLRSLVAIIVICGTLSAAAAFGGSIESGHSTQNSALIGHATDEECCDSGFDCQCSPATAIVVLADRRIPSTHGAWSLPAQRGFVEILPENPYHPPRPH